MLVRLKMFFFFLIKQEKNIEIIHFGYAHFKNVNKNDVNIQTAFTSKNTQRKNILEVSP